MYASSVASASRRSLASQSSRAMAALTTPGLGGTRWTGAVPNGKFSLTAEPWNRTCHRSCSISAISVVWNDPTHFVLWVSQLVISATHVLHDCYRTPSMSCVVAAPERGPESRRTGWERVDRTSGAGSRMRP